MIRSFELPDLRTLHRYRKQGVYLDSITLLTKGKLLIPARAVFSPLSEAVGVYTGLYQPKDKSVPLIAQASHALGSSVAHLTFLTPDKAVEPVGVAELIEYLIKKLGEREAQVLVADVDEKTATFETLRRLSFSIYARQRIWRIGGYPRKGLPELKWREIVSQDEFNARKLYHAIVPTMVQQVESTPASEMSGWVYYHQGDLLGYADVRQGPRGVWVQPFIHPEMEDVGVHLTSLFAALRPSERRPVYVCLRSYQAGLSLHLEDLDAEVSVSQAVMVRRLAAMVKKPELSPLPSINGGTEVTTPYNQVQPENGQHSQN
jgi:hypothetical protein